MNNKNSQSHAPSKLPLWVGFFLFTLAAIFVPDWNNSSVQQGAMLGVILSLALLVFVLVKWRKRLSQSDVQTSRQVAKKLSQGWVIGLMLLGAVILSQIVRSDATRDFALGAMTVFAAFGSIVGLVVTYGKKGLSQEE